VGKREIHDSIGTYKLQKKDCAPLSYCIGYVIEVNNHVVNLAGS